MHRYAKYRNYLHKNKLAQKLLHKWNGINKGAIAKNLLLAGLGCFFLGALFLLGAYAWLSHTLPNPEEIGTRDIVQATQIYDRTGEHLLYTIAADEKRTLVSIEEIPQNVIDATVTAEDRNFYNHHGISFKGILRAVFQNIIELDATGQGASTITQQLVKNAILTTEKTYSRKFKEIILSLALERRYAKEEILQMYLNEIPYGSTNYGVESASQAYFGKHVSDLTLAESATVAAIPNRPTALLNNPDLLKERRDWILDGMVELSYITQEEADAAKAEETPVSLHVGDITAPHFVFWIKEQLEETYSEREVEQGGLKVISTLDYDKQILAETAVKNGIDTNGASAGFNNSGLLALDPKTGQVLAMVGSVDYFNEEIDGQVNVTVQPLQPGSSIKPIIYAAAFEKGYTPNTIVWDVDTVFPTATGNYEPKNYSGTTLGHMTLRKALQGSLNIPAVKTLYLVGVEHALDFAERLGYTTFEDRSRFGLAIVLGGGEVKMLEHANAYAAFANQGKQSDVVGILKVERMASGEVLEEWKAEEHVPEQVIDNNVAATITNVLSDNNARAYIFGATNWLTLGSRPVAAKTGTTNEYKDAWTMGYTPSLVAGVWVGNTDGTKMKSGSDSSRTAAPIWNEFMRAALDGTPIEAFPSPSIPVTGKDMLDGKIPTTTYTIDTSSGYLATDRTPERYREEVTCGEYHTILKYVDKNDPLGAAPTAPESDPYYKIWEDALQAWITTHNSRPDVEPMVTCGDIPTEEDDVHTAQNEPDIEIKNPDNNDEVARQFEVTIDAETRRPFSRVEYFIDDVLVESSTSMDTASITLPAWVDAGDHMLKATIYDDVDNTMSDSVRLDVTEDGDTGTFRLTNPFNGQLIEKSSSTTTYDIVIEIPDEEDISYLEITTKNLWNGDVTVVGSSLNPSSITTIKWTLPNPARYQLTARAASQDGSTLESIPVMVRVKNAPPSSSIPIEAVIPAL